MRRSVGDPSYRNTVAQFHELSPAFNWMITLSDLQVDKLSDTYRAVRFENIAGLPDSAFVLSESRGDGTPDNGFLSGTYRVYSAKSYNSPMLAPSGMLISFNDKNPLTKRYLSEGFSLPEPWGVWSTEVQAEIKFSLSRPPTGPISVELTTNGWLAKRS